MRLDAGHLSVEDIRHRFDAIAHSFDEASYVHRATFDGLLERLLPVSVKPELILDLGCATGESTRRLRKHYRGTRVLGMDVSHAMLKAAAKKRRWLSAAEEIEADACQLPLTTGSVDLVFANMLLPWVGDLPACFNEVARVLKPGGVFAFATLGPDSLGEFRELLESPDYVFDFPDMHDVGDAAVRAGLADPVLDIDRLTVTYADADKLVADLSAVGASRSLEKTMLAGREDGWSLRFELVYGHAWGTGPRQDPGEFHIDPGAIGQIRRR